MRLPSRSAAVNSRSFHGLSSGSETIFACAAFHCTKSWSTSALLERLSQKRIGLTLPYDSRKGRLVINSLQFPLRCLLGAKIVPAVFHSCDPKCLANGSRKCLKPVVLPM